MTNNLLDNGSFTTTANSDGTDPVRKAHVKVWGTFSATIVLQQQIDGAWVDVADESYTAAVDKQYDNSEAYPLRLSCTHSSGTANYRIQGRA